MAKFDIDVTIKELAPYVDKTTKFDYPICYMGFYDNKPVFKLSENNIHVLDFSDCKNLHYDFVSTKDAIKVIIRSVAAIKKMLVDKKLKIIKKDFE